ncbi:MAG: uracil-DNA glycosylase [bacterium]
MSAVRPDPSVELESLHQAMRACTRCPELVRSRSQVVPGSGNLRAKIVFVGEGPGEKEDQQGVPFVGPAGQLLDKLLAEIGLSRQDVFITNVIKCRPAGNRDPLPAEIAECREHLFAQLLLINPAVVCTLGRFAMATLVKEDLSITRVHGNQYKMPGFIAIPLFHPSFVLRDDTGDRLVEMRADFQMLKGLLESLGA